MIILTWANYYTEGKEDKETNVSKPKIHFFFCLTCEFFAKWEPRATSSRFTDILTKSRLGIPSGGWKVFNLVPRVSHLTIPWRLVGKYFRF